MAQRRWYLGPWVTVGYAVVAAAVIAAGWATYVEVREAREAGDRARHTQAVLEQIALLEAEVINAETGQRGYLLTGQEEYLEPYAHGRTAVVGALGRLKELVAGSPAQLARLGVVDELVTAKLDELQQTIDLRRTVGLDAALDVVRTHAGKGLADRIRAVLGEMRGEENQTLEQRVDQRGARFWWASRVALLAAGLALIVVGFSTLAVNSNVRWRALLERILRESEERLRVTLRSIGDAVIATDPNGRVVFMNPVAQHLTGWTDADAIGRPLDEVFHIVNEETRAVVQSPVERVLREGTVVGLANHTVLVGHTGGETPIDDSGAPIRDADGEIMGVVLVFRDVSDRKQQERERGLLHREGEARAAAEHASRMKDEFLAILSHELRSPLQGILGWLTVLRELRSDPEQRERALQAIERGVHQQAQLVNDILEMSRIVAGKLQIESAQVELAGVVEDCIDQALPLAQRKGLEVTSDVAKCDAVLGDRNRLRQSITNLLANAIKFTPSGGRIEVRCHREGTDVVVVVRDSGEGIAADFLPRIFDRFSQGDAGSRPASGGLGLGLSIVRQIVELHGGSIRAESEGPGRGATFTMRVPLAVDGGQADQCPTDSVHGERSTLEGLRVLVVDDDTETRESLALLLKFRGANVSDVGSVSEALNRCAHEPPDVIISDISMPEQDGYALADQLRAGGSHVVILALTGFASPNDRTRATEAGFDAHVSKPVDLDQLVATIIGLVVRTDDTPRTAPSGG
jgi:PAS domain S-box-containing protein